MRTPLLTAPQMNSFDIKASCLTCTDDAKCSCAIPSSATSCSAPAAIMSTGCKALTEFSASYSCKMAFPGLPGYTASAQWASKGGNVGSTCPVCVFDCAPGACTSQWTAPSGSPGSGSPSAANLNHVRNPRQGRAYFFGGTKQWIQTTFDQVYTVTQLEYQQRGGIIEARGGWHPASPLREPNRGEPQRPRRMACLTTLRSSHDD